MRVLSILTFAVSVVLAGAASAQTAAPDAPATPPKMICVRGQADTGSHFGGTKVCHTESEWTMIHNQSNNTMERFDTLQNKQMSSGGR